MIYLRGGREGISHRQQRIKEDYRKLGSISVSEQLPTYPSPNPTLTLTCYQLTVVELGEG